MATTIFFLACCLSRAYAQSQNLLPNGDFSDVNKIIGWTTEGPGSIGFSYTPNADSGTASGSLYIVTGDAFNVQHATSACFRVTPGAPFSFGGKFEGSVTTDMWSPPITGLANLSCTVFGNNDCTGTNNFYNSGLSDFGNPAPGFQSFPEVDAMIDGFARSAYCGVSISTSASIGQDTDGVVATINVDDLYFNSTAPADIAIKLGGYMTGNWYDPAESGHGFLLEFTAQANTLIAAWFVYTPDGSAQSWVYGQGTYDTSTNVVTIPAEITSGTKFPPLFDKDDVERTLWGTLTFSFSDCNHGTAIWNSTVPGYGSGSIPIVRLTQVAGTSCPI
jgi:hypothetical protein